MVNARSLSVVLLAAGIVGGIAFDPRPERPEIRRGDYRVLEVDLHAHTTFSDGSLSPFSLVRQADRRGLDVLGLTEHNTVWAGKLGRAYARMTGGPIILVGEEITTASFHVIAVGLTETVTANQPVKGVLADIHAQGGFAIAAHPVAHFWPALLPVRSDFDGAELMHPIALREAAAGGWRWNDMVKFYEEAEPPLAAIGSSDYHWGSVLGLCRTLVFAKEATEGSVLEALKAKRTVVIDVNGRLRGDAEMIALLERDPVTPRSSDYAYRGEGTADRVLRSAGFVGLVGLVLFGISAGSRGSSRRSRRPEDS